MKKNWLIISFLIVLFSFIVLNTVYASECLSDEDCIGNCDYCNETGYCAPNQILCIGNCDYCTGSGIEFNCARDPSLCIGNCDYCTGSGIEFNCARDPSLCIGNCDYCTGSGIEFNCAANETVCELMYCGDCKKDSDINYNCKYDSTEDEDCPTCQECAALNLCSNIPNGTDPKNECCGGDCRYGYCDGFGSCDYWPDTADCGTCALCNGAGSCSVYDESQDEDCGFCEECSSLKHCGYADGTDPKGDCIGNCDVCNGAGGCTKDPSLCIGNCDYCTGSGINFNCAANETVCELMYCGDCKKDSDINYNCKYDETEDEDCNPFDYIYGVAMCDHWPDGNSYTWDYAEPFDSVCAALDECTHDGITHTCADADDTDGVPVVNDSVRTCIAPCDEDADCPTNVCRDDCTCGIEVNIYSPGEGETLSSQIVDLEYTISEVPFWTGYSLDNKPNKTISCGSTTCNKEFVVSAGPHSVTVYANDSHGITHADVVNFEVNISGGCPHVYVWDGNEYVLDNNLLPFSEGIQGDVEDYYKLEKLLVQENGKYSLMIGEFEQEHSFFDQVQLLAVDHDSDVKIAPSPFGEILTYKNPVPTFAYDNEFNDITFALNQIDGNAFEGHKNDFIILNFGRVESDNAKLVMRSDLPPGETKWSVHVQVLKDGEWEEVAIVMPRNYWADDAVDLSDYLTDEDLIVRLYFTSTHKIDFVGLDTSEPEEFDVRYGNLVSATHSEEGNVKQKIVKSDGTYAELIPGQDIKLDFTLPNGNREVRDFIFYSKGYYYKIE